MYRKSEPAITESDIEKFEIMALLLIASDSPKEMIDEKLRIIAEMREELHDYDVPQ